MKEKPYRQAMLCLMHSMVNTRPDISFTGIKIYEQSNKNSLVKHKANFAYLKGTKNHGITYRGNPHNLVAPLQLVGYSDADWGGDIKERKSTNEYCFLLASGVVSWSSNRQTSISLSTTEAEYLAAMDAVKEALWLRRLLQDLWQPQL